MTQLIEVQAVEMTPAVMQDLEDRGAIIRLAPNRHTPSVAKGDNRDELIYQSDPAHGPHQLIAVTVDSPRFGNFGIHTDNEEFMLIGDPATKTMVIMVALCSQEELEQKAASGTLGASDFIALRAKYNDPEVSFFTMLKDIPHGEAAAEGEGKPGSFYVTEPGNMATHVTDFGDYDVRVVEG